MQSHMTDNMGQGCHHNHSYLMADVYVNTASAIGYYRFDQFIRLSGQMSFSVTCTWISKHDSVYTGAIYQRSSGQT